MADGFDWQHLIQSERNAFVIDLAAALCPGRE